MFGVHTFMSLHVFVGLALIPPVLLKLAATGWRFARYYSRKEAYVEHGAPQIAMRLLAPLFVAATVVLFASGVAMGILHGQALAFARQLHGPASVVWLVLFAIHALVYLKRALVSSRQEIIAAAGRSVQGRRVRGYLIAAAVISDSSSAPRLSPSSTTGSTCTATTTAATTPTQRARPAKRVAQFPLTGPLI